MRWSVFAILPALFGLTLSHSISADLLIHGGPIYTASEYMPRAEAVYVKDDRIVFVGGMKAAERFVSDTTRRIDLDGKTMVPAMMRYVSERALDTGFQIGVHAIGDKANRVALDIFDELFEGRDQGVRFRVEHAQHIDPADIPRFGELGVIAAMQGIHMSSDRPWAIDRLGERRIVEGAYVWRKLLETGAVIVNGTDVPVEPINPIASFYSLVTRRTLDGKPPGGFEPSQKLTREEALRAYTLDAAYGAFEEDIKGSIEIGKLADFTVFDQNIMTVPEDELLDTRVAMTIVGREVVFEQ